MNAPFDRVSSGSPRRRPARVLRKPSLRANNTARRPIPRQLAARDGTRSTCALLALFPAPITNQSRLSSSITAGLVECIVYRTSPPGVLERPSTRNWNSCYPEILLAREGWFFFVSVSCFFLRGKTVVWFDSGKSVETVLQVIF